MAVGDSPVAFSGVGIFPCIEVINTKFNQIIVSGLDLLPLFPITHPDPASGPYIEFLAFRFYICKPKNIEEIRL